MCSPKELVVFLGITFLAVVAANGGHAQERAIPNKVFQGTVDNIIKADARVPIGTCEFVGQNLPDDTNCAIFHTCIATSPSVVISLMCPEGTYFNPSINTCDANYVCPSIAVPL